jgi:molecular chaperone Hsp33
VPASTPLNPAEAGLEVRTDFVRSRHALVARANFSELYVDYYLHLAANDLHPAAAHDLLFKRALAAFVLHCASRPWNELIAWTINFQTPLLNVFLVGDNDTGAVTGRVFADQVKAGPEGLFFADVVRLGEPKRRSAVSFAGGDPFAAVERFYAQSEQRLVRCFEPAEEEFVLICEHPDADLDWLRTLTAASVQSLDQRETLAPMERRIYRWHCGCNQARMLEVLAPSMRADPDALFGSGDTLEIRCPRCGARHVITREAMEAHLAADGDPPAPEEIS